MKEELKEGHLAESIRIRKKKKHEELNALRLRALAKPIDAPYFVKDPTPEELKNLHPIFINPEAKVP